LDLSENEFGDEGAKDIASAFSKGFMQLTSLNLSSNRIGNAGAIALAHEIRYL